MKKTLFSLLFLAIFAPLAMAQNDAPREFSTTYVSSCQSYLWSVTGETYSADTVVTYTTTDTVYVLDLQITQPFQGFETLDTQRCSYFWRGQLRTESGVHNDSVPARVISATHNTCDSIFRLNLTLHNVEYDGESDSACGHYTWRDSTYHESGVYFDTIRLFDSTCTHIDSINLKIVSRITSESFDSACGRYHWRDTVVVAPFEGMIEKIDTATVGRCDSVFVLHLAARVDTASMVERKNCGPYTWYGIVCDSTGVYTIDTANAEGCVVHRRLKLNYYQPRINSADTTVITCDKYRFTRPDSSSLNRDITADTDFTYTIHMIQTNVAQCYDSTVTMHVRLKHSTTSDTDYVYACDKYYWPANKKSYVKDTIDKFKYEDTNSVGCDSMAVLNLVVRKSPIITSINGEWRLKAGETAVLSATCTEGCRYSWSYGSVEDHGDTLVIPNCQGNIDVTLETALDYPDANNLVCYDTSWITIVTFVGIDGTESSNLVLYPNPTVGQLHIESSEAINQIQLYNAVGQQVALYPAEQVIDLSQMGKGTYTLRILFANGDTAIRKIVLTK